MISLRDGMGSGSDGKYSFDTFAAAVAVTCFPQPSPTLPGHPPKDPAVDLAVTSAWSPRAPYTKYTLKSTTHVVPDYPLTPIQRCGSTCIQSPCSTCRADTFSQTRQYHGYCCHSIHQDVLQSLCIAEHIDFFHELGAVSIDYLKKTDLQVQIPPRGQVAISLKGKARNIQLICLRISRSVAPRRQV